MVVESTLAYYENATFMVVKSFIVQTPSARKNSWT